MHLYQRAAKVLGRHIQAMTDPSALTYQVAPLSS